MRRDRTFRVITTPLTAEEAAALVGQAAGAIGELIRWHRKHRAERNGAELLTRSNSGSEGQHDSAECGHK